MASTVALIDYGAGNLHSVHNALKAVGAEVIVTSDPSVVRNCNRIVLPGVGAFGACASGLFAVEGMKDALQHAVWAGGTPFLGICVGMQLLFDSSEEPYVVPGIAGLGWMDGVVTALQPNDEVKVPHMGWNVVEPVGDESIIKAGEAYFLHGYAVEADDQRDVAAVTHHGGRVVAAVADRNILGVQFHPEKSQAYGLDLLARFLEWQP